MVEESRNKKKKLLKQIPITLTKEEETKTKTAFDRMPKYTLGHKKNQHIQILDGVKIHNYWNNIFKRKATLAPYFSEAAFGSDSDKKIEYRELWKDPEYRKKYFPQNYLDSNIENELK